MVRACSWMSSRHFIAVCGPFVDVGFPLAICLVPFNCIRIDTSSTSELFASKLAGCARAKSIQHINICHSSLIDHCDRKITTTQFPTFIAIIKQPHVKHQ